MAEVNHAVAYSSYTPSFHFFLSLDIQHVSQKERMLNSPGVSQYVIQSTRSQPYLPLTAVLPSTGIQTGAINLFCRQYGFHSILMQNLSSFSFALTPQCPGPDQYKEEGGMSSAERTTTTNQVLRVQGHRIKPPPSLSQALRTAQHMPGVGKLLSYT